MNQSENNFQELKKLLKLKQHEIPPPGYFHTFSDQVVSRIRAGEGSGGQALTEKLHINAPWLVSLLQVFETRPGLVGAFATCLCFLLVLGVVVADRSDTTPKDILAVSPATAPETSVASIAPPMMAANAGDESGIAVSTNPVISLQPAATLFGQQNPLFQSASFAPAVR